MLKERVSEKQLRKPSVKELLYALVIAYYEDVIETRKIAKLFRTELWSRFSKVLSDYGFQVPSFDEVHKLLWDFFVKLMMNRFEMADTVRKWGVSSVLALDYSPHPWKNGKVEVLIRLRGAGNWVEAMEKMKYEYNRLKKTLSRRVCT